MAGGPSVYAANYMLNKSLKGTNFTPPSTWYLALLSTASETNLRNNVIASASELPHTLGYSRKEILPSQISVSTAGQCQITVDVIFNTATGSWGTVYQAALMDTSAYNTGNVWWFGPLTVSAVIQTGDVLKIPANSFNINM